MSMHSFHGAQGKGATKTLRDAKRAEAHARSASYGHVGDWSCGHRHSVTMAIIRCGLVSPRAAAALLAT